MLSSNDISGKEVATKLLTTLSFVKGECSNDFSKVTKPKIYFIDKESFSKYRGIPSIALVLKCCLDERKEDDVAILCSNLYEVDLVQSALDTLEKKYVQYVPCLNSVLPTSDEKQVLIKELDSDSTLILVTDYRSFRGCESSHSVIITDLEEPHSANVIAEMLSRTMADLDFIALPKENYLNNKQIETIFKEWKRRNYTDETIVTFDDEYESEIIFRFQIPPRITMLKMPLKIPVNGFPSLRYTSRIQTDTAYL